MEFAGQEVAGVRDDPQGPLTLFRRLYEGPPGHDDTHLPYRRAASAFTGWQLRRGLLNRADGPHRAAWYPPPSRLARAAARILPLKRR